MAPTQPNTYQKPSMAIRAAIRADYVAGHGSIKSLAAKHHISFATAKTWSLEGGWGRLRAAREQSEIAAVLRIANPPPDPIAGNARLQAISDQIARVLDQLSDDLDPNERSNLVRALDLLLDRERILSGQPLPGSMRPAPVRKPKGPQAPIEPIGPADPQS